MERIVEYFLCPCCGYKNVRTQEEAAMPAMVVMLPPTRIDSLGKCLCGYEFERDIKGTRVTGGRKL